jgi:sarcosine oxidase subunit alpha
MDALEVLRIEKGFIGLGAEADGRTTPGDLGLAGLLGRNKEFVGKAALQRPALNAPGRQQLVGLVPVNVADTLPEGAQLMDTPAPGPAGCSIGHLSSAVHSPSLGHAIALGLVKDGHSRLGEIVYVADPIRGRESVAARICKPCFFDPEGGRVHGK